MPYKDKKKRNEAGRRWTKNHPEKVRDKHLREVYGITLEDYNLLLAKQDYKCFLCGSEKSGNRGNAFCVDHSHKTGKIRGLLCFSCNILLGVYEKMIENNLTDKVNDYIKRS